MKVLLEGPLLTQSGYGEHARLIYRALKSQPNLQVFVLPNNWGRTSWIISEDEEMKTIEADIRAYSTINKEQTTMDIHVHVGILNEFERKGKTSICVTAGIETDRVSPEWILKSYQGAPDKIIVPSNHSRDSFKNVTYYAKNEAGDQHPISFNENCKISVIPYPVKNVASEDLDIKLDTKFNFLSIALWGPRKNMINMVEWFMQEFLNDEVGLVLKTSLASGSNIDRRMTINAVREIVKKHKDAKCKVYLLHGDLSEAQIHSLYKREDIHAFVSATSGEGFGLPIFEASYYGLPIVATDWSGHLDFLKAPYKQNGKEKIKKLFAKVDYDLKKIQKEAVWDGILDKESRWAFAKEHSFKRKLRDVYRDYGLYKKWAKDLQKYNNKEFSVEKIYKRIVEEITISENKRSSKKPNEMDIVVI